MSTSHPKVKAFLVCDQIIRSTDGKYSVIGIFRRIHAPSYPVFHARFGLYMMLGEMNGRYDLAVQFVDPRDGVVLGKAELKGVEHRRPLEDFETGINLPGLQFMKPGVYEIHLLCNGELLHVDTLHAAMVEAGGKENPGGAS